MQLDLSTTADVKAQMEANIAKAAAFRQLEEAERLRQKLAFRLYRQQHQQLQRAHRLLVLEHRELKAKYVRACDVITSLEYDIQELAQRRSHFPTED